MKGWTCSGRFLRRETRFMSTSPRSSGCCTARSAKRNSEGRDFSHGPRPVSLPGFRRLCWSVLLLVFLCLSVLSRAAPNSPFPPARKITDCPGCRTRLYGAPLSAALPTPRTSFRWSLTDRKRRNVKNCPKLIIEGW